MSTVDGLTADIGASGSFQPKHLTVPVTIFFYEFRENKNVACPYLVTDAKKKLLLNKVSFYQGHLDLGKRLYRVPEKGSIQVTLFNTMGMVVNVFVVLYDLADMPPNSQTFIRQRTFYLPKNLSDVPEDNQRWLRYLIHLRF